MNGFTSNHRSWLPCKDPPKERSNEIRLERAWKETGDFHSSLIDSGYQYQVQHCKRDGDRMLLYELMEVELLCTEQSLQVRWERQIISIADGLVIEGATFFKWWMGVERLCITATTTEESSSLLRYGGDGRNPSTYI